jgi:hypothetical protein
MRSFGARGVQEIMPAVGSHPVVEVEGPAESGPEDDLATEGTPASYQPFQERCSDKPDAQTFCVLSTNCCRSWSSGSMVTTGR